MRANSVRALGFAAAALATGLWHGSAAAYNPDTHQLIVDHAWEVMLASQDPALTTGRGLFKNFKTPPISLRTAPSNSAEPITQAQWDKFLADIHSSILALNRLPHGLVQSSPPCADIGPSFPSLGRVSTRISTGYGGIVPVFDGDSHSGANCDTMNPVSGARRGIYALLGSGPNGVTPGLAGDFGNTLGQGLVLGWHAKSGDDNLDDLEIGINAGQIVINAPEPWLGGLSANQVVEVGLAVFAAPFVCFASIFTGDNCLDDAREFSDKANPLTALAGLVPPFDADITSSDYTGLPHFINGIKGTGLPNNYYDDRRGMFYEDAGPQGDLPGAIDLVIMLASDYAGLVVEPDKALMVRRYDIGEGGDDGHLNQGPKRSSWAWNRETLGHQQMTPIDNFAYFGWKSFRDDPQHDVKNLRWPLHAFGDVTVPMHVTSTTGHGHRPYEDAINSYDVLDNLRYLIPNAPAGQDFDAENQLEQARGILRNAYTIRQKIAAWRKQHGTRSDIPVRDLVTDLALSTVAYTNDFINEHSDEPDGFGFPYCDACSTEWHVGKKAHSIGIYHDSVSLLGFERPLFEQSVAYTLAFLVSASEVGPSAHQECQDAGAQCAGDSECCSPSVGSCRVSSGDVLGHCVTPDTVSNATKTCNSADECAAGFECSNGGCTAECNQQTACPLGYQCLSGLCSNLPCDSAHTCNGGAACVNGYCSGGTQCVTDGQCTTGYCANGFCEKACTAGAQCSGGGCVNNSCCATGGRTCQAGGDCCSGQCTNGVCAAPGEEGAACAQDSGCIAGKCVAGHCSSACTSSSDCPTGSCEAGRCCLGLNSVCLSTADCCGGSTLHVCAAGTCQPALTSGQQCGPSSAPCLVGSCINGICSTSCSSATDCPGGQSECVLGACCLDDPAPCSQNSDCCGGTCDNNKCATVVVR